MPPTTSDAQETEIETFRLVLRSPRASDAAPISIMANDPDVTAMTARLPYPYALADGQAYVERQRHENETGAGAGFVIERLSDGRLLGCIGYSPRGTAMEFGYWLGREHWGQGYATEAARAIVDHVFETTNAPAVVAACRVINQASRRVIEKCGLRYVESGLDPAPARGGALPVDRFRLSRQDWASFKEWRPAQRRARLTDQQAMCLCD